MATGPNIQHLLDEAAKCCQALGLHPNTMLEIFKSDSDWGFILKIDALIETAAKEVIRGILRPNMNNDHFTNDELQRFASGLPMNGKTSLLKLLQAARCDPDICDFIEATRNVRNTFAHNIRHANDSLLTVIQTRQDWRALLKRLTPIINYQDEEWLKLVEADNKLMRFSVLHYTLVFLTLAYHLALKDLPKQLDLRELQK